MTDEDDDLDEEKVWLGICQVAAKHTRISVQRARAILEDAGYHAYGHLGIMDAIDVIEHALRMVGEER
jgi:hypothetical protein